MISHDFNDISGKKAFLTDQARILLMLWRIGTDVPWFILLATIYFCPSFLIQIYLVSNTDTSAKILENEKGYKAG